jgi:hypothetical protein
MRGNRATLQGAVWFLSAPPLLRDGVGAMRLAMVEHDPSLKAGASVWVDAASFRARSGISQRRRYFEMV